MLLRLFFLYPLAAYGGDPPPLSPYGKFDKKRQTKSPLRS
jgi:hypothetical protein